jgi:hypothetical protein
MLNKKYRTAEEGKSLKIDIHYSIFDIFFYCFDRFSNQACGFAGGTWAFPFELCIPSLKAWKITVRSHKK